MFSKKKRFKKPTIKSLTGTTYVREVIGVLLAATAMYFFIALWSFHPFDQTLFRFSSLQRSIKNWGGMLGAQIAAVMLYLFGMTAYLVLGLVLFLAIALFWDFKQRQDVGRWIGGLVLCLASAGLCAALEFDLVYAFAGGMLGNGVRSVLEPVFGTSGILIVLGALLWSGFVATFRVPVLRVVRVATTTTFDFVQELLSDARKIVRWCVNFCKRSSKKPERAIVKGDAYWNKIVEHAGSTNSVDQISSQLAWAAYRPETAQVQAQTSLPLAFEQVEQKIENELEHEQAHTVARAQADTREIFGKKFLRLQNSVVKINIFAAQDGEPSWYEQLYEALEDQFDAHDDDQSFVLPDAGDFAQAIAQKDHAREEELFAQKGKMLEEKLAHFGLKGEVTSIKPGPVITLFEYKPDINSKISKIISLEDDLAMVLRAHSIRIIAPIPGKNAVGFEIANQGREDIFIAQTLSDDIFEKSDARLPLVLGVDVTGSPVVQDLVSMPHLLVGGATGSGKSVGLNTILVSLLCKRSPDEMKLILIDPKRLEFTPYTDLPHLLFPIITQPHKAAQVLKWVVQEMEQRYERMASTGVRSVQEYQKMVEQGKRDNQGDLLEPMPYMVVMIDELADLMMVSAREVEGYIIRIAQMARAAGIHMILATQRPSVDVVTGLIKVNFPSRIAFRVSSKVDSRTILDSTGAEKLLGRGDMLFLNASSSQLQRVHGSYVSDSEVEKLADFWRAQAEPEYLDLREEMTKLQQSEAVDDQDELYDQVLEFVRQRDEISISMLQRQYRIGFNRSARLIEKLEFDGIIAPAQGSKPRKVLD